MANVSEGVELDNNTANSRTDFREIMVCAALLIAITELGGIWNEVHRMRHEQVKNAWYSLPKEGKRISKALLVKTDWKALHTSKAKSPLMDRWK
jgi:hypothetical protein